MEVEVEVMPALAPVEIQATVPTAVIYLQPPTATRQPISQSKLVAGVVAARVELEEVNTKTGRPDQLAKAPMVVVRVVEMVVMSAVSGRPAAGPEPAEEVGHR